MEKLELRKEIGFTEEKLLQVLELVLSNDNIEIICDEADQILDTIFLEIKKEGLNFCADQNLSQYCLDLASVSSTYAYQEGFKEGIRLFRTILKY